MAKGKTQEELMDFYNQQLQQKEMESNIVSLAQNQSQIPFPEPNANLIKEQLDLGPELKRIDNLLRSNTLIEGKWVRPTDENLIILSDYGVHIIREFIAWYVNKNTLLSNYEEEMILDKMKDASTVLNELIFRNYEKIFYQPSFNACKQELIDRIKKRMELKTFAREIVGLNSSQEEIKREVLLELENKVEEELIIIQKELLNNKLKRFTFILRVVQDTIHSTYNRAWNGQERRSIRQHMTVTETTGGFNLPQQMEKQGGFRKFFSK